MKKGTIGCISVAVLAYLVFAAILLFLKISDSRYYHASPTHSRDTSGFKDGRVGLLEDSSREIDNLRPASELMAIPQRHEFTPGEITLIWADEKEVGKGPDQDTWVDELHGDDSIDLIAVATWFPDENDPIPPKPNTRYPLSFFDVNTFEKLNGDALDTLGIPDTFRSIDPPAKYHTPRISFLFRTSGMKFVRCNKVILGDLRTSAKVGYDLEDINEVQSHTISKGEWARVDSALLMWHNSEIVARFQFLTGEPETITLPRKTGAQVIGCNNLRIQWIEAVPGEIDVNSVRSDPFSRGASTSMPEKQRELLVKLQKENHTNLHSFTIKPDIDEDDIEPPKIVIRSSSDTMLRDHTAIITPDGLSWDWRREKEVEKAGFFFASITDPNPSADEVQFLHFPHIVEMEWKLPQVPGTPNPNPGEDLFEIRIPRLTMIREMENPKKEMESAEDNLIALLSVATQVTWKHRNKWDDHDPENFPEDYSFRNTTPQELLNWYRANTKNCNVKYDDENFVLYVNQEEESWWTRMKNRFPLLRPKPFP